MLRMQQEAAERVRKMHERARKFADENPIPVTKNEDAVRRDPTPAEKHLGIHEDASPHELMHKKSPPSFLAGFGEDKDQLFLLLIAVLLVKNDAPIELILALLYIAM